LYTPCPHISKVKQRPLRINNGQQQTPFTKKQLAPEHKYTYNVHMEHIRFEWDNRKSRENKQKHKVSFEEAQTVFLDENAIRYFDPDHSDDEDRFIMLGMSFTLRVLIVCHCYREDDSVIRIISARKADKREQLAYWS